MTRLLSLGFGLILIASMAGCAMSARVPVTGFVYNVAKGAEIATANPVATKVGKSCATSILGIVGYGDASNDTAAKSAGITPISHVDTENLGVIGVYAQGCTIVYGE
jgi:hypothetical protein